MKSIIISLLTLGAALASAQIEQLDDLPECVNSCVGTVFGGGQKIGNCEPLDVECLCKNDEFVGTINSCVRSKCSQADVDVAAQFAYNFCLSAGVTINTNAPTSAPTSGSISAPTATPTGNATQTGTGGPDPSETGAGSALAVSGISILGGAVAAFLLL